MARTAITPTSLIAEGTVNLTALSATASPTTGVGNGVSFSNTGQQTVIVSAGTATGQTATILVGTTVLGQAVSSFTVNLITSAIQTLGPFHTLDDQPGSNTVFVDFTFSAGTTTCGLLQWVGVY